MSTLLSSQSIGAIINITGYIALIVGAILILKSKIKTDNIKDLTERVKILEKEREYSREQHIENQKAISNLEGQLKTYKEIPLQQIANSLESLPKLVESNGKILSVLQKSAAIAADDADADGTLVRTNESGA